MTRTVSLVLLPPGTVARVVSIAGGYGKFRRLLEMGLSPGTLIRVVNNSAGPVIIEARGVTIALGRGLAKSLMVEVVGPENPSSPGR